MHTYTLTLGLASFQLYSALFNIIVLEFHKFYRFTFIWNAKGFVIERVFELKLKFTVRISGRGKGINIECDCQFDQNAVLNNILATCNELKNFESSKCWPLIYS